MTASRNIPLPGTERSLACAALAAARPEVLILGGGVNGVAVLRDLALNGVRAALVDTQDFCAGASGASSRMAHGGLRYLEGREFRLVAEAARERNCLLHDAPHAVRPLEIVVPLQYRLRGFVGAVLRFLGLSRQPGPMSLAALKGALVLYERFGAVRRALPRHRTRLFRKGFDAGLAPDIRAVVSYFDGQILNPELLVLEMLADALAHPGIGAINHATWQIDGAGGVLVTDPLSGGQALLHPKVIVNAAGAAVDQVNRRLGIAGQLVRGIKGAHVLLRHPQLQDRMAGRAFYFDDGQGRMVICLPVGASVLMGTTEVETADPMDRDVAPAEVDYLLASLSRLFTDLTIRPADVVAVTSGIRPLQAGEGNATQAARDHALVEGRHGTVPVLSMVGGKWTTFRSFAEQASDRVLALLSQTRTVSTAGRAYPGVGGAKPQEFALRHGCSLSRAEALLQRYGAAAEAVAAHCAGKDQPLADLPAYSGAEIDWLCSARMACTLEDLVLRRSGLVPSGQLTERGLKAIAGQMAETLRKGDDWTIAQVAKAMQDPRILGFDAAGKMA